MEAASARYAARDRFGPSFGEPTQTQLQRFIQNAVDPQNYEPNLALNLEIADLINAKKGNAPREAAVAIVNYINHRNPNVQLLALSLLDIGVKNCGYPFHLQISTKEFLNELVRRFPERPPIRPTRVQMRILEAIEEWRQTICQTSRYKEDLGFIRDMHRLLSYKGYIFPEVRKEDAAVLNPSDNLRSADEMEEEEKAAQSAKLQELIRRGGPEDLQEANRLMKIMAGYDTRQKTDYRAKAAEEVGKIQQKAKLLEERLQNFKEGDQMTEGDIFEEMASSLQSAQRKIQKMCEEESDDQEAVAKLFEINDSIHRTVERYKLMKKGDLDAASKIPQGTLGTLTGVKKTGDNELSLIDFDPPAESSSNTQASNNTDLLGGDTAPQAAQKPESLEDDLLGLSFQDRSYGQGGGIALGFGANTNVPGPSLLSSTMQQSSAKPPSQTQASQPQTGPSHSKPNYDIMSAFSNSRPTSQPTTPNPSLFQQQAQRQQAQPPPPQSDPFAALSSSNLRSASPFSNPSRTSTPSGFNFSASMSQPPPAPAPVNPSQTTNGAPMDDDWDFSSALPEDTAPTSQELVVSDQDINITFHVKRQGPTEPVLAVLAVFSNKTPNAITEYTFQVAVTKSGRKLAPFQERGITQPIEIHGVNKGQASNVKIRWKASYKVGSVVKQEQGEVPPLNIS
ncbi:hypothetical protein MMC25_005111 [Agyrium rufum]|nr:hypothetical protein [Agyrium rufum]